MKKYYTYIDEHGTPCVRNDECYVLTAVLTNPQSKELFDKSFETIKLNFFGRRDYYFHRSDLLSHLRGKEKQVSSFVKDLKKSLNTPFIVFQVIVDNQSAISKGWDRQYVYNRAFRIILGNILKFAIAKGVNVSILSEASSDAQDINLYKSFFHYIANGIDRLKVGHNEAKIHFTSLNFVTKLNNDSGAQIADLLGKSGKHILQIEKRTLLEDSLKNLDKLLYEVLRKNLFKTPPNVKDSKKLKLYPEINSLTILS